MMTMLRLCMSNSSARIIVYGRVFLACMQTEPILYAWDCCFSSDEEGVSFIICVVKYVICKFSIDLINYLMQTCAVRSSYTRGSAYFEQRCQNVYRPR
jgi:hypothetical protein